MENSIKKIAIIGSGPAGIIAADYLLNHSNFKIDLIDAGLTSHVKIKAETKGLIPKKTLFGNAFVYKRLDGLKFIFDKKSSFDTSHAIGGLSNVWGANISALHEKYISQWKINKQEFEVAFDYVLKRIPICAKSDMIDEQYDVKISSEHIIQDGISHAHTIFTDVERENLRKNKIAIGASKLAINTHKCIRCEKCMEGCSENAIFNAAHLIPILQKSTRFKYKPHFILSKYNENKKKVKIFLSNTESKIELVSEYDAIIIATGVIDSTNIVYQSKNMISDFQVKESKKYYIPFISTKLFSRSKSSQDLSLSHLFIQHLKGSSMLHCQLYPSFHLIDYILKNKLGYIPSLILRPFKFLLKYLYVGMIYLDSEDSGTFNVKNSKKVFKVRGVESSKSKIRLNSFLSAMKKVRKSSHLIPLPFLLGSKLGHSQHFGGTLPMKSRPTAFETDLFGRPYKHKRTFIVDSSVLPSIPALPTTITVMANAVRICQSLIK